MKPRITLAQWTFSVPVYEGDISFNHSTPRPFTPFEKLVLRLIHKDLWERFDENTLGWDPQIGLGDFSTGSLTSMGCIKETADGYTITKTGLQALKEGQLPGSPSKEYFRFSLNPITQEIHPKYLPGRTGANAPLDELPECIQDMDLESLRESYLEKAKPKWHHTGVTRFSNCEFDEVYESKESYNVNFVYRPEAGTVEIDLPGHPHASIVEYYRSDFKTVQRDIRSALDSQKSEFPLVFEQGKIPRLLEKIPTTAHELNLFAVSDKKYITSLPEHNCIILTPSSLSKIQDRKNLLVPYEKDLFSDYDGIYNLSKNEYYQFHSVEVDQTPWGKLAVGSFWIQYEVPLAFEQLKKGWYAHPLNNLLFGKVELKKKAWFSWVSEDSETAMVYRDILVEIRPEFISILTMGPLLQLEIEQSPEIYEKEISESLLEDLFRDLLLDLFRSHQKTAWTPLIALFNTLKKAFAEILPTLGTSIQNRGHQLTLVQQQCLGIQEQIQEWRAQFPVNPPIPGNWADTLQRITEFEDQLKRSIYSQIKPAQRHLIWFDTSSLLNTNKKQRLDDMLYSIQNQHEYLLAIPFQVLEELNGLKESDDECAASARSVLRILEKHKEHIQYLPSRLESLPNGFDPEIADNQILSCGQWYLPLAPILVSDDRNQRLKGDGLHYKTFDSEEALRSFPSRQSSQNSNKKKKKKKK